MFGHQVPDARAGFYCRPSVDDRIRVDPDPGLSRSVERERDAGIASDVSEFDVVPHVGAHQIVTVQPYPNDGYLGTPVGVDGAQVGHWSRLDQLAKFRR